MEPFEQHRPAVRVGPKQQDGAVAVPVVEREVLEVRLIGVDPVCSLSAAGCPSPVCTGTTSEQ